MQSLNKVELTGIVTGIRTEKVGETTVTLLSVATTYAYRSNSGEPIIETIDHKVTVWDSPKTADAARTAKGHAVTLSGRLRSFCFTNSNGTETIRTEIYAQSFTDLILRNGTERIDPEYI